MLPTTTLLSNYVATESEGEQTQTTHVDATVLGARVEVGQVKEASQLRDTPIVRILVANNGVKKVPFAANGLCSGWGVE